MLTIACFAELADQFCCINAAKIDAAHTAWFGPKPFAWPWVWAMGVGGCCSRDEKITLVAVTLFKLPFFLAAGIFGKSKEWVWRFFLATMALLITF